MNPPNRFDRLDLFTQDGGGALERWQPDPIDELTAANRGRQAEIARRRAAADAHRMVQGRLASTLRDRPVATALSSLADGRLLDVTDSYLSLVGFDRDEVIGRPAAELGLLPAEQIGAIARQIREQGAAPDVVIKVRTKAGATRHLLVSLQRVDVGDELCAVSIVYDVTDQSASTGSPPA